MVGGLVGEGVMMMGVLYCFGILCQLAGQQQSPVRNISLSGSKSVFLASSGGG